MKIKKRKPLIPDETPLEFFGKLQIPPHWRFIGDKNYTYAPNCVSHGKVYEVAPGTIWRICIQIPKSRGGICEYRDKTKQFSCILSNVQGNELNSFIQNYGKIQDE